MKFLALLLAPILAFSAVGCGGDGEYKEVYGSISIDFGGILDCPDELPRGYSDVPTTQIIVRDVNEKFLIELEANPFNFLSTGCIAGSWINLFSGENLPKLDKYIIDAGRRGEIFVDADDFEVDEDGDVRIFQFTLGD